MNWFQYLPFIRKVKIEQKHLKKNRFYSFSFLTIFWPCMFYSSIVFWYLYTKIHIHYTLGVINFLMGGLPTTNHGCISSLWWGDHFRTRSIPERSSSTYRGSSFLQVGFTLIIQYFLSKRWPNDLKFIKNGFSSMTNRLQLISLSFEKFTVTPIFSNAECLLNSIKSVAFYFSLEVLGCDGLVIFGSQTYFLMIG